MKTTWQDHLTPAERERINSIDGERKALTAEYRRIYDRCRKRMKLAGTKVGRENAEENTPING